MSMRKQISYHKKCARQNLRVFKILRRPYFNGDDEEYSRLLVGVAVQYKSEQETLDDLRGIKRRR